MSGETEYRCFVGGLAWATADADLERTFSQFGEVIDSKVRYTRDRTPGFNRGPMIPMVLILDGSDSDLCFSVT